MSDGRSFTDSFSSWDVGSHFLLPGNSFSFAFDCHYSGYWGYCFSVRPLYNIATDIDFVRHPHFESVLWYLDLLLSPTVRFTSLLFGSLHPFAYCQGYIFFLTIDREFMFVHEFFYEIDCLVFVQLPFSVSQIVFRNEILAILVNSIFIDAVSHLRLDSIRLLTRYLRAVHSFPLWSIRLFSPPFSM